MADKAGGTHDDRSRDVLAMLDRQLPLVQPPPSVWMSIERQLDAALAHPPVARTAGGGRLRTLALAAVVVLAAGSTAVWWYLNRPAAWDVIRLDAPGGPARLDEGVWIETPAGATARIQIGDIGTVDVEPNTRLRVLSARPDEHRLAMSRGRISAQILAPPRLFFVETPASTVVDLGCAYTMEVDEAGTGLLRVTSGWASLEWDQLESLVPAGASCPTRPDIGPGTPVFDDASVKLREALFAFDFGEKGVDVAALDVILSEARVRDTLTLWHLVSRVPAEQRPRVVDRIAELAPLPRGVTRETALELDETVLQLWREELAWLW